MGAGCAARVLFYTKSGASRRTCLVYCPPTLFLEGPRGLLTCGVPAEPHAAQGVFSFMRGIRSLGWSWLSVRVPGCLGSGGLAAGRPGPGVGRAGSPGAPPWAPGHPLPASGRLPLCVCVLISRGHGSDCIGATLGTSSSFNHPFPMSGHVMRCWGASAYAQRGLRSAHHRASAPLGLGALAARPSGCWGPTCVEAEPLTRRWPGRGASLDGGACPGPDPHGHRSPCIGAPHLL